MMSGQDAIYPDCEFEFDECPPLCSIPEEEEVVLFSWAGLELDEGMDSNCAHLIRCLNNFDIFDHPASTTPLAFSPDADLNTIALSRATAFYINNIIKASRARQSKQITAFMVQSPGRRDDDIAESFSALRLGGTQCNSCDSYPSHRLIPCDHPVCYDHFLEHDSEESRSSAVCARCLKVSKIFFLFLSPFLPAILLFLHFTSFA